MTKPLDRTKRRKIRHFNRIVSAGYEIFSKRGIFRATLDEISEEADVGKGTVYSHFKSKLHLISYLSKKSIGDLLDYCKKEIDGIRDPCELIKKLISAHFAFFDKRKTLFSVLFFVRGALHQDFESRHVRQMQSDYERYMGFLAESLEYGVKRGGFRRINPANQAYVLHGIIVGFVSQWIINGRKGSFADKADLVAETFLHGIVRDGRKQEDKDCQSDPRRGDEQAVFAGRKKEREEGQKKKEREDEAKGLRGCERNKLEMSQ